MGGVLGHLKSFWSERDVLANLEIDLGLYYVTIYIVCEGQTEIENTRTMRVRRKGSEKWEGQMKSKV